MKKLTLNKATVDQLSDDITFVGGFTGSENTGDNTTGVSQQGCAPGLPTYPVSCKPRDCCNATSTCETIYICTTWSFRGCTLQMA